MNKNLKCLTKQERRKLLRTAHRRAMEGIRTSVLKPVDDFCRFMGLPKKDLSKQFKRAKGYSFYPQQLTD